MWKNKSRIAVMTLIAWIGLSSTPGLASIAPEARILAPAGAIKNGEKCFTGPEWATLAKIIVRYNGYEDEIQLANDHIEVLRTQLKVRELQITDARMTIKLLEQERKAEEAKRKRKRILLIAGGVVVAAAAGFTVGVFK
jgi:hypothetical protein